MQERCTARFTCNVTVSSAATVASHLSPSISYVWSIWSMPYYRARVSTCSNWRDLETIHDRLSSSGFLSRSPAEHTNYEQRCGTIDSICSLCFLEWEHRFPTLSRISFISQTASVIGGFQSASRPLKLCKSWISSGPKSCRWDCFIRWSVAEYFRLLLRLPCTIYDKNEKEMVTRFG